MTKLSAWFAIAALTLAGVSAAGCKRKTGEEQVDTSGDPVKVKSAGGSGSSATGAPATLGSAAATGSAAELKPGELPPECEDYKTAMQKLASCTQIPQVTRDALKQSYDGAAKTWATMTAESKATLAKACKGGADSVIAATAGCK